MFNYILTQNSLTLFINGETKPRIIPNNDKAKKIVQHIKEYNNYFYDDELEATKEIIFQLLSPAKLIEHKTDNRFKLNFETNELYLVGYEDKPINNYLAKRILEFIDQQLPIESLINFWKNCLANPEPLAVEGLFEFLEKHKYPLTYEGNFIGYKKVTSYSNTDNHQDFAGWYIDDRNLVRNSKKQFASKELSNKFREFLTNQKPVFVDSHSKTIKQSIGDVVEMEREKCDFNRSKDCSYGLHVGSWDYSKSFSGDVFIYVEVNPADVVSVPIGYQHEKLRTCKYKILGIAEYEELNTDFMEVSSSNSLFLRDNN